jgi:hypothetical protein
MVGLGILAMVLKVATINWPVHNHAGMHEAASLELTLQLAWQGQSG